MCHRRLRVVIERVGGQEEVLILQFHIVGKERQLSVGVVLAPVGGKDAAVIDKLSTLEEITEAVHAVIIETVGVERGLAVLEHYIVAGTRQLVVTVIIGIVTEKRERIALIHLHMSESLEGVALFKEVGAVAVEACSHMVEVYVAFEHLGIVVLELVVTQLVSMYQIDTLVGRTRLGLTHGRALFLGLLLGNRRHGLHNTKGTQA